MKIFSYTMTLAALALLAMSPCIKADVVVFADEISYSNGSLPATLATGTGSFATSGDVDVVDSQVDLLASATRAQFGVTSSNPDTSFGVLEMDLLRSQGGAGQLFFQVNQGEARNTGNNPAPGFSYTLGTGATFADGTIGTDPLVPFALYFNTTGQTQAYTGPNASAQTLAPSTYDVWIDGTRRSNDIADREDVAVTGIDSFFVQTFGNQAGTNARFDNISLTALTPVPEPSSIAAVILAGGLFFSRRKRNA